MNTPAKILPTFTAEDLAVIEELIALQGAENDSAFCRTWLKRDSTQWSRIKRKDAETGLPIYALAVQDFHATLDALREDVERIRRERAFREAMSGRTYCELDVFKMVLTALQKIPAGAKERMVAYLARTNGGKSTLIDQAVMQLKARRTHARESWRRSYKAALIDLLNDLQLMPAHFRRRKLKDGKQLKLNPHRRTEHELEAALIAGLREQDLIIAIDDAQIFGARSINLLRTILTETNTKLLIASDPDLYARWSRAAWLEAGQLLTRTSEVIELPPLTAAEVKPFLRGVHLNGDGEAAAQALATAANSFGLIGFVAATAKQLLGKPHVDLQQVTEAIDRKALSWNRAPGNAGRAVALRRVAR